MSTEPNTGLIHVASQVIPAKEVYRDALQPAARELGKGLGQTASIVNTVLRPLRTIQLTWDTLFDRLDGWLSEKLSGTPDVDVCEPSPTVAGPVVTGLLFAADEAELRDLFVQLLATSMVQHTRDHAHPAFAEAIKQMTPLEARLISRFASNGNVPYVIVRAHQWSGKKKDELWDAPIDTLSDDQVRLLFEHPPSGPWRSETRLTALSNEFPSPDMLIASFQNLARLGLVTLDEEHFAHDLTTYCRILRASPTVEHCESIRKAGLVPSFARAVILNTEFGKLFCKACVSPK